jgi:hypothetical protein
MMDYELINHTLGVWRENLPALCPKLAAKLGSIRESVFARGECEL